MDGKKDLSFVSLNVRGLNETDKRCKVFSWLRYNKSDVVFLQETFCVEKANAILTAIGKVT